MRRRQRRLVLSGRFAQQMFRRFENRASSTQGNLTNELLREGLQVDAELPQMLLWRRLDTTVPLHMRARLQCHKQLRDEDAAASKKLCTVVSCPVLKSCTFATETAEALATETAGMDMRASKSVAMKGAKRTMQFLK